MSRIRGRFRCLACFLQEIEVTQACSQQWYDQTRPKLQCRNKSNFIWFLLHAKIHLSQTLHQFPSPDSDCMAGQSDAVSFDTDVERPTPLGGLVSPQFRFL